jgi:hypothetical protein
LGKPVLPLGTRLFPNGNANSPFGKPQKPLGKCQKPLGKPDIPSGKNVRPGDNSSLSLHSFVSTLGQSDFVLLSLLGEKVTTAQKDFRVSVLLCVQRALLGEITPRMRSVEVILGADTFHLRVWHEGSRTDKETEDFDAVVITDLAADFWVGQEPPKVPTFEFISCDPPDKPTIEGTLVFARKED